MGKRLENLDGFQTIHLRAGAKDGTLREKRLALEMTQQEVADKAKISLSSYQKFELGDRNIRTASFELVCRVLKALEMDPTAFYEGEYVFGEPTIFDKEGRKYIRSGRLIDEEINEQEAANAMRIQFRRQYTAADGAESGSAGSRSRRWSMSSWAGKKATTPEICLSLKKAA